MSKQSIQANSKYINDIERTLRAETSLVKKTDSKLLENQQVYYDNVLFVHRRAFDSLLAKMSTYKHLLLQIKEAYEDALSIRDKQLKSTAIISHIFKREKENSKITIDKLTEESTFLKKQIRNLSEEIEDQKKQNEKIQKDAHVDYLSLSEERDARYTLFFENTKLKNEIKQLKADAKSNGNKDPFVIKLALEQSRKDLSKVTKQLNNLLQDYEDAVPKNDYEMIQNQFIAKCDDFDSIYKELEQIKKQHRELIEEYNKLKDEFEESKEKCHELEQCGTPRPDWDMCPEFIGGGITRWKLLTNGLSSRSRLEVILKELGPTSREDLEYFEGLGKDPIVPEYLQYEGQIRNLRLKQRDISILINDIWTSKITEGKGISLQEFLKIYFIERYHQPTIRAEWAYNLYSGCERMLDDPQIKLFWGVLHGKISHDVYYAHKQEWDELKKRVMNGLGLDNMKSTLEEIEKVLRKMFPLKSEVDLKNILEVARKQLKVKNYTQEIDVEKLFIETEEGFDRNDLARELFRQRQMSQERYVREIVLQLGGKSNFNKPITVENLKRAFAIIDPHIDHIIMESNIRWVFSDNSTDLSMISPLSLKTVAVKLMSGNIQRVGPRYRGRTFKYKRA